MALSCWEANAFPPPKSLHQALHPIAFTSHPPRCPLLCRASVCSRNWSRDGTHGVGWLLLFRGDACPHVHGGGRDSLQDAPFTQLRSHASILQHRELLLHPPQPQVPPKTLPPRPAAGTGRASWQGRPAPGLAASTGRLGKHPALCWAKQKRLGRGAKAANSSFLFPALYCLPAIFACKQ